MVDLEYGITLDGKKTEIIRDESKKVMLKQENYKVREWNGENKQLKFQNFNFYFNSGNGKTKPSTTYVLSFEYYSDPGPFDMGVNCSNVCVRALNNADMLVKKDGKRGTIWIQEQGRHKFEYEFTTAADQDAFYFALMTGNDGVAYFWDFKIVEKGGDGTNPDVGNDPEQKDETTEGGEPEAPPTEGADPEEGGSTEGGEPNEG